MRPVIESLEGRTLLSGTIGSAASHHHGGIAHYSAITALQNLIGAYSGTYTTKQGDTGDIYLQIDRQTATTLKGFISVDAYGASGTVKLKNIGGQAFTLTYSKKGFSGTVNAKVRSAQIVGTFSIKVNGKSASGSFTLHGVLPNGE